MLQRFYQGMVLAENILVINKFQFYYSTVILPCSIYTGLKITAVREHKQLYLSIYLYICNCGKTEIDFVNEGVCLFLYVEFLYDFQVN